MLVGQRMTKNPITVKPDTPVSDAQFLMRKEKVHRFPVIGKDGRLKGIVTEKDLLHATPSPATTLDVYEMNYLLSKLSGALSSIGGNIVALGTFLGEDSSQTLLTMKVQGCSEKALGEAVSPFVQSIVDCREV